MFIKHNLSTPVSGWTCQAERNTSHREKPRTQSARSGDVLGQLAEHVLRLRHLGGKSPACEAVASGSMNSCRRLSTSHGEDLG